MTLDCCNSGGALDQDNQYQALGAAERYIGGQGRYLPPPPEELVEEIEGIIGFKPRALSRNVNATSLLITGCQSHQTSADAYIEGKYMGACTYYLIKNIKANPATNYKALVDNMNNDLASQGYTQRPELNGPESLFDKSYLRSYAEEDLTSIPVFEDPNLAGVQVAPLPTEKKDNKKLIIGLAIVVAIAAVIYFIA